MSAPRSASIRTNRPCPSSRQASISSHSRRELRIAPPGVAQGAQERTGTAVDTGLRRRIARHLLARIRLIADGPDRRPLPDGDLGPAGATREQGLHRCPEQRGLAAEDPVDGLDDDAGLARDLGQRDTVAAFAEQQAGRRHDVASRLRGLRRAAR